MGFGIVPVPCQIKRADVGARADLGQLVRHLGCGLNAMPRILGQALGQQLEEFPGQRDLLQIHVFGIEFDIDLAVQHFGCGAAEKRFANHAPVQDGSQGINIRPAVHRHGTGALFGRHVGRGTHGAAGGCQFRRIDGRGDPEIRQQRHERVVERSNQDVVLVVQCGRPHQDVAGFHIPMHQLFPMGVVQGPCNRCQEDANLRKIELADPTNH